jgi:CSLREA domain-containing protein
VAATVLLALPASASAQVTVNSFGDAVAGECTPEPLGCTLREAMSSTPESTIIDLPAGTYQLTEGPLPAGGSRFLRGAGARTTMITANNLSRVMSVIAGDVSVSGVTISDGRVDNGEGGGIHVAPGTDLNLFDSTVEGNTAETGGGIYSAGGLHIERSAISFNRAAGDTPRGGGLAVVADDTELLDTTISGNISDATGGGLYTTGNVEMHNVTIARNDALGPSPSGGGIQQLFDDPNDLTVAFNTLVVENFGGNCLGTSNDQIAARFSMADDLLCNVPQEPAFGNTPIPPETASISDLRDNGGPTDTHELFADSPALAEAEPGTCSGEYDQRGLARDLGGACDVGAYERAAALSVTRQTDRNFLCTESDCSLREAIGLVATEGEVGVPMGNYVLSLGELRVTREIVVRGVGARVTTFTAGSNSRVLSVSDGGFVTLIRVRITGGDPAIGQGPFGSAGGGIAVRDGGVSLLDSAVDDNEASVGGGIYADDGGVVLTDSTVSRNRATDVEVGTGGGLYLVEALSFLDNSTISGNSAIRAAGGIMTIGTELHLSSVTVANNSLVSPTPAGGSAIFRQTIPDDTIERGATEARNTLFAGNPGIDCAGNGPFTEFNGITDDASCPGSDFPDAFIGALAANDGETDTHALLENSPAIDAGANCPPADQRGVTRPQGLACDVGAFEREGPTVAGSLTVATRVDNDDGGTAGPADFLVRVRAGGDEVESDPGNAQGIAYTLPPGNYVVSGDTRGRRYTVAVGGDCASNGTVALADGDVRRCTVTFDDIAPPPAGPPPPPPPPPPTAEQLPEPEAGEEVNAEVARGTVRIRLPGTNRFVELEEGQQLPVGTVVDTTKGRVTLVAAGGQQATFYDGIFRIGQGRGARPLTTLTLVEALRCPRGRNASAAAKKKKRRLWGNGRGRFRTKGKHSAATVVGTKWLVEDRCTSTLTRVTQGRVSVRDFVKKKTVTVRAGKKYVARAKR